MVSKLSLYFSLPNISAISSVHTHTNKTPSDGTFIPTSPVLPAADVWYRAAAASGSPNIAPWFPPSLLRCVQAQAVQAACRRATLLPVAPGGKSPSMQRWSGGQHPHPTIWDRNQGSQGKDGGNRKQIPQN